MKTISYSPAVEDQQLANLIEEITTRLQAGETCDADEYIARYPNYADRLRDWIGVMSAMADLGHSLAVGAANRSAHDSAASSARLGGPTFDLLGDFRLLRELGRGGMGVVYEAEQISLGRRVALKVLPFAAMLDKKQLARFKNEARAAATLEHPNIVAIYSVGVERSVHYYAMQLVEGRSLAELIANMKTGRPPSPISTVETSVEVSKTPADDTAKAAPPTLQSNSSATFFRTVAQLGIQAAEALQHAHQHGILHRDIKPANLLVNDEGKLWIADFGLARIETETGLTMTGDMLGTLRYMSPEQAFSQEEVDHRSDLYSLGVTLYELVTLEPAYGAEGRSNLLHQIATESIPSARQHNRDVPASLNLIIHKATEKDPVHRYQSAQELAEDLRRFLDSKPVEAQPVSRPQPLAKLSRLSFRSLAISLSAAALAITCAAILLLVRGDDGEEKARVAVEEGDRIEIIQNDAAPLAGGPSESKQPASANPSVSTEEAAAKTNKNFALSFDGKDDYVEIPSLKYDGSHPITIEFCAQPESEHHFQQLVLISNFKYVDEQEYGISLFQRGDTYPTPTYASWAMAYSAQNRKSHSLIGPPDAWKIGRTSHIAFVAQGRRYRFYLDGKLWKHGELGADPAISDEPFSLAGHTFLNGFFQGTLDEMRISKIPRYRKDFTPPPRYKPDKHTVALYHFDEGRGKKLIDSSGNNHHGKILGATWIPENDEP